MCLDFKILISRVSGDLKAEWDHADSGRQLDQNVCLIQHCSCIEIADRGQRQNLARISGNTDTCQKTNS